ncbi:MAG: hypothetical protein ACKVRN_04340 [Pyrinomonadaceae bacterium]
MPTSQTINGLSMSYVFTFDFGSEEILDLSSAKLKQGLETFTSTYYFLGEGKQIEIGSSEHLLLKAYKKEIYELRFKQAGLVQRKSLILQLDPIELDGLTYNSVEVVRNKIRLDTTVQIHEMGVGSVVFWLDLEGKENFQTEGLSGFGDTANLRTKVNWSGGSNKELRIDGIFSIEELARFVIICLNSIFFDDSLRASDVENRTLTNVVKKMLADNKTLEYVHSFICQETTRNMILVHEQIDSYPIFHFNFKNKTDADINFINTFVENNKKQIRGLVAKDKNWDKKTDQIVDEFLKTSSFSTRESIKWFTHNTGSLKIYSHEIETDVLTSKVLITFELELVLTMKHYVYKIIRNLDYFTNLSKEELPLRALAKFRNREMRRLDEYYNLDFLQKDTTRNRIDRFKVILNVEDVLQIALKKLESLNLFLNTEHQFASQRRQTIISTVFGIFGAGNLANAFLIHLIKDRNFVIPLGWHVFNVLMSMLVIGVIIFFITNNKK